MLKQFLLTNWYNLIGGQKPQFLNLATISSCNESYGNDLVLIFTDYDKEPRFILKVVRDCKYNFKLERENYALVALHQDSSVRNYIPVSYSSGDIKGRFYFIQQGLRGQNLRNSLHATGLNDNTITLLERSISLLCSINMSSPGGVDRNRNCDGVDVNDILSKETDFAAVGIDGNGFRSIAESYDFFVAMGKKFFLHGDFWPANILVDEKKAVVNGIIDWEFSTPNFFAPTDIIWFLITLSNAVFVHRHSSNSLIDSFKWGFFSEGDHNDILRKYYQQYISLIDFTGNNLFKPLLLLTLATMSMREKVAYGSHKAMDNECLELLKFALTHDSFMDNV